jgi:hypothetical protein
VISEMAMSGTLPGSGAAGAVPIVGGIYLGGTGSGT